MLKRSFKASAGLYDRISQGLGKAPPKDTRALTMKQKGYADVKKLGKGAFGHAVLVVREETREHFVAKYMRYKDLSKTEKEFIYREVDTMRRLSNEGGHPYVVRFRESFVLANGKLCIIMDYCDGGDLSQLISAQRKRKALFHEQQVHLWLLQLLTAIDFLHKHKVLHRDIKPANVFMHSGVAKLADLGLSKQVMDKQTGKQKHTQCGSPLYLAPEVHMGRSYDKAVDIWSLGCTLFEMMMQTHAFVGENNAEILSNIAWARHAPILSSQWSKELCAIVKWMLALKPEDRPTALEVLEEPLFADALRANAIAPSAVAHIAEGARPGFKKNSPASTMELTVPNPKPPCTIDHL